MDRSTRVAAGALGAFAATILLLVLDAGLSAATAAPGPPFYVGSVQHVLGLEGTAAWVVGLVLVVAIGTAWGAAFGLVVRRFSAWTGMAFATVPLLWEYVTAPVFFDQPVFFGFDPATIVATVVLVVGVWGGVMGAVARRRLGAVAHGGTPAPAT